MKITFNLKNPKAEVSAIRLIITHKGKVYRKYTGISTKTRQWHKTKRDGQFPTDESTANKLKAIRLNLENALNEYSTEAEIVTAIDRVLVQDRRDPDWPGVTFPGENTVRGLAVFNKRVGLFGSEGSAKEFASDGSYADSASQPIAVAECVDPIILNMKLVDAVQPLRTEPRQIPDNIMQHFGEDLVLNDVGRLVTATLGQFSILRLERDSQLVLPVYDYCLPDKECEPGIQDDPCTMFSRINFPVDEFFPPDTLEIAEDYRSAKQNLEN